MKVLSAATGESHESEQARRSQENSRYPAKERKGCPAQAALLAGLVAGDNLLLLLASADIAALFTFF